MSQKPVSLHKQLSVAALLRSVKAVFDATAAPKRVIYSPADILMSALAVFGLKCPSLLNFETLTNTESVARNLKSLYGVDNVPSDSQLRARLDRIDTSVVYQAIGAVWHKFIASGMHRSFEYLDGHLLVSADGTGQFSSSTQSCPQCCVKNTRQGKQFYHQMYAAAVVHPDKRGIALPIEAEPITRDTADGSTRKNDCERNAAKRLLPRLRKQYPTLPIIILEDALAANAPHIELLNQENFRYIIGIKFTDHQHLYDQMQQRLETGDYWELERQDEQLTIYGVRVFKAIELNRSNPNCQPTLVEYWEQDRCGKKLYFSWITDIPVTRRNVWEIVKAGRSRWRVENETFNTLKNLGYHFEHNYGHGEKHLCTNMGLLCLLAFLIDEIQKHVCPLYQEARAKTNANKYFWERLRGIFLELEVPDWTMLYGIISGQIKGRIQFVPDTG